MISFLLTVIFTWPFVTKIPTFYYERGDYQLTGAFLAYNESQLRNGKIFEQNYFHGFQFYPQPYSLVYSDLRLIPTLIYAPIFWLTHKFVFSVNLTTFLTFVLSFISIFYTLNYFTRQRLASVIGAIIFTFNPLTFSRFPEHFELLNKYFLPLVFLFAYKFLDLPNLKNAFLFFLIFTLNAFSATYFQIFAIIILPIFVLPIFIWRIIKKDIHYFIQVFKYSLVFLAFIPIFLYFDGAYLNFSNQEGSKRTLLENAFYSARLIDYFCSTPKNFLYGSFVKDIEKFRAPLENGTLNYQEHTLFLNIIPTILFIFSSIWLFKRLKEKKADLQKKLLLISFSLVLFISFIFTFGPFFQGWNGTNGSLKLPFYYFYQYLPFFQGLRAPTRFLFIFYIPFTLLITLGLSHLSKKFKNKTYYFLFFGILLLTLFIESYTPQPMNPPYETTSSFIKKIENIQAKDKLTFLGGKKTLHIPVLTSSNDVESIYVNWAAVTHEKIVNGNRGSFLSTDQGIFLKNLDDKLDEETLKQLFLLGIDYIIFHFDLLDQKTDQYKSWQNLYQIGTIFNQNDIKILDLKKYNFTGRKCDFEKDLDATVKVAKEEKFNQNFYVVELKNKSDCYLTSVYLEKYKKIDFYINFLKQTALLKLPVFFEPYQTKLFAEVYGNLRWQ
ncbi:MAG: hypothetical protein V1808_00540 [Candidatus Daviesbacteria bacterium]